jgi:predicted flap endonuclease-1-like 5' DNA nuclease
MWPICATMPWYWSLIPILLGLITGWWIWANRPRIETAGYEAPAREAPRVEPAPVIVPPVPAPEPVAFQAPEPEVPAAAIGAAAAGLTAIGIPAAVGAPDDLHQIKGVGPKLNALLNSLGITRFDQIAAWTSGDVAKVDDHLGAFKGRIGRDNWIEQAGLLAKGMIAEFEARFGKLDSENQ